MPSDKQDLAVVVDNLTGQRDIGIGKDGDLLSVSGFETSLDLSLLTNRRASSSEVTQTQYRRGWIGDLVSAASRLVGSTLWIYEQRRLDAQVLRAIEDTARNALKWMLEDEAVSNIQVTAEQVSAHSVRLEVDLFIGNNVVRRYFTLWGRTGGL